MITKIPINWTHINYILFVICHLLKASRIVFYHFQIITYVGSLVFQGEDSMVLMVIDKSIKDLLEDAKAPLGLIEYAGNQYGSDLTLMDLEPAMVISVIDAVRYR